MKNDSEIADLLTPIDADQRSVNVEVDVLADESHRGISEGGMTATGMLTHQSGLAIGTGMAAHPGCSLVGATVDICLAGSTVVNSDAAANAPASSYNAG
jgi:hypothetical protein